MIADTATDDFEVSGSPEVAAADPVESTETVVAETTDTAETETPPEKAETKPDAADRNTDGTFKAKPPKGSLNRLIWEREEAERKTAAEADRAAKAEARAVKAEADLAAARQPRTESKPVTTETVEKFAYPTYDAWLTTHEQGSYEDYIEDRAVARVKHEQARETRERTQRDESEAVQTAAVAHRAREVIARQTHADYDLKVTAGQAAMDAAGFAHLPAALGKAILDSDRSAEIVYDLASHPEVAIQLAQEAAQLPATAAPVMRRLLESRLTGAPSGSPVSAKPVTTAKPPIKPVGSSPTSVDDPPDPDSGSLDEHVAYYNRKDREGRRR